MKFNLGDKVRIKSNGVVGIIIARGYNEYLDENDKQQSFEEYQIEAEKYYQCNEDEIELITNAKVINNGRLVLGLNEEENIIKESKCCGNCCEFDKSTGICEYDNIAVCGNSSICENYYPSIQEINVEDINDPVSHPSHYTYGSIEVMDYIEDKGFNFALGNAVKYISRAGRKDANKEIEDLEKANWYLNREIERLKSLQGE